MRTSARLMVISMTVVLSLALAAPAMAAPGDVEQDGLVNVNVGDVTIQLPLAIAANVCDVNVNVLAEQLETGDAECTVEAESGAVIPGIGDGDGDGNVDQEGLVNVNVGDVTLQLPVAVAANVCDVNVNVLARQLKSGDATCDAAAESDAG